MSCLVAAVLLAASGARASVTIQGAAPARPAKPLVFPGLIVELATSDNWKLKAKYNPAKTGRKSFLLLHGTGGRKEDWYHLVRPLFRRGYGYLALDLRGHGESRTAPDGTAAIWRKFVVSKNYNEYLNMVSDLEAGMAYLAAQGVAEEDIVIIGADVGGSIGLRYAALHPKVAMVALLSPGMKYQDVTTVNAMRAYKGRPIFMMYSEADKTSARETPILASFARMAVGDKNLTVVAAPREHGAKMLRGPMIGKVFDWILQPVPSEAAVSTDAASGSVSLSSAPANPAEEADDADWMD
ncbi:MAG: alpha/beta fold hydrolase [Elusimicrobiota bacterium]